MRSAWCNPLTLLRVWQTTAVWVNLGSIFFSWLPGLVLASHRLNILAWSCLPGISVENQDRRDSGLIAEMDGLTKEMQGLLKPQWIIAKNAHQRLS
jgi:hypothetical protein